MCCGAAYFYAITDKAICERTAIGIVKTGGCNLIRSGSETRNAVAAASSASALSLPL